MPTNATTEYRRGTRRSSGCYLTSLDTAMNSLALDKILNALLYEGYILYPYRASSRKNRQRFTFGRIYPHIYSLAQGERVPFAAPRGDASFRSRGAFFAPDGEGGELTVETSDRIACRHRPRRF